MPNSPTIVAASLDSKQLEDSINKLVQTVNAKTDEMAKHFTDKVGQMEQVIKNFGNIKFESSSSGGATKSITEGQKSLETQTKKTTQAAKEQQMTFDQLVQGLKQAMGVVSNFNTLRQHIDPSKQDYAEYERALARIVEYNEKLRASALGLEQVLGQVNQSQQQTTQSAHQYTEEIRKQAQSIRDSQQWKEKGFAVVNGTTLYNLESDTTPLKNRVALEEQLVQLHKSSEASIMQQAADENTLAQATRLTDEELKKIYVDQQRINEEINRHANRGKADGTSPFQSYDSLRQSMAAVLGLQEQQIKLADSETGSYNQLNATLKQLKQTYDALSKSDRNSEQGKVLIASIHEVERAIQRIRSQAARPVSLESIIGINGKGGLSEKTLDDIAYKMQRLASYRSGLNVETQKKEISTVNAEYDRLKKKMDEVMQKNQSMIASNNALGRSWNYMKNRLAFYFTVGASTSFVKQLIEVRSQYEMNEKALGILLDSASRGTRIFNELSQMSLVSPYTLIELSNAAKQLTAYDIAAKDVVDTTRRLADMASAVGVPVERLTYALGQIKAYGYLNSRDARMFANAGIPLVKQLADYYSELEGKMVSTADVYDRMKKKAIDYTDVMQVVNKMTDEGGKFFDFQAKMADTLKVRLANLNLAWNNMLNDMGKETQGVLTGGLKTLAVIFRNWRDIQRVLGTVLTALGAYKLAVILAGMATKSSIGNSAVAAFFTLAKGVRSSRDAVALFSTAVKQIPFAGWVTAIASIVSYFYLFNSSGDDVKQKLGEIRNAFNGVRKEVSDLFADAMKTDKLGTQLTKLRDMIELAKTELGITIPINLEEVDESKIKDKLREVKRFIDNYVNFSQTFSEAAAGTKFNELMNEFGANARTTYTSITESINTVITALEELKRTLPMSKNEIKILEELKAGQREDESRIEYLQRLINLYEQLGLIGQKKTTPTISFFGSSESNIEELEKNQEKALDRLGIKNREVFTNMLTDVQSYYSSSSIAAYQFEQQVMRVAKKIDINNIPVEQRTLRLTAAINEEASQNNWNQFEKEFARQIANEKFGTNITISDESKNSAETELHDWQKRQQKWMDEHGIDVKLNFQTNDTEVSYAKRMLQAAKDAQDEVKIQERKLKVGTGSQEDLDKAVAASKKAREEARAAGADLSSLDKERVKAQKQAETELQKALKDEIQLIEQVRSQYKKLADAGVKRGTALTMVTTQFGASIEHINKILQKNGLPKFDIKAFAGTDDPHAILAMLKAQIDRAKTSSNIKPEEIKALEVEVGKVVVDAQVYDTTKITKGLNNELDKLKEEYELAVELDANPELGGMFAEMFDIDLETLPKTAEEYADQYTKFLNKYLKEKGSGLSLPNLLNLTSWDMNAFREQMEKGDMNKEWYDVILKGYLATREARKKETSETIKDYEKLLEKYAEYEYKVSQIQKEAERERATARKNGANKEILDAIDNRERQELAKVAFEEFQKSPEWVVATGDLAGMTDKAIGGLIRKIEDYKKKAKDLDPKQIKQINSALTSLYKQQRQGNPFKAISNAMLEAKNRAAEFNPAIKAAEKELNELENGKKDQDRLAETADKIGKLKARIKELKDEQKEAGKVSASTLVDGINAAIQVAQQATSVFTEMMSALGKGDSVKDVERLFSIIDKAGQSAAIGAQIGGGWGAAIGGVMGAVSGIISSFADEWSGNADITRDVKRSERAVRQLELAFVDLQQAIEKAYGTATIGANKLALANKELQLEELKRQLQLEQSRKEKNRDEDRILDLKTQIKELTYEIRNGYTEIVDDLMGTDVGGFAENLVSSMIDAFKQGEDYMDVFNKKFDEMIDNMIMKSIVSRVVSQYLDAVWERLENRISSRAKDEAAAYSEAQSKLSEAESMTDTELLHKLQSLASYDWADDVLSGDRGEDVRQYWQKYVDDYRKAVKDEEQAAKERYDAVKAFSDSDVDYIMKEVTEIMPELGEKLKSILGEYYKFGESSEVQLSALQQGIQGITEDTAGALEGMLNGMSQQVYLQSDLLTQIRDAVIGLTTDAGLGVQAQMLFQLQQSYLVQQSIEGMMRGVLSPSERAFQVELVS